MHKIQYGIDVLLAQEPPWKSKRIAFVTNHAATTNLFVPSRVALLQQGFNLVKLFSPEAYPTHVNPTGKKHLDLLSGISNAETIFDAPLPDFINVARTYIVLKDWLLHIQPHLMYI